MQYRSFIRLNDNIVIHIDKVDRKNNLITYTRGDFKKTPNNTITIDVFLNEIANGRLTRYISNPSALKELFEA